MIVASNHYNPLTNWFIGQSLDAAQGTMDRKMTETNDSVCKSQADSSLEKMLGICQRKWQKLQGIYI